MAKLICVYCKKEFERPNWRIRQKKAKQVFCSRECHISYNQKYNSGENSPYWNQIKTKCAFCGKEIYVKPSKFKKHNIFFCDKKCQDNFQRKTRPKMQDSPTWKGGKTISSRGYIYEYHPEHPFANNKGYVPLHRIVMEKHIGRYLKPEEVVHHKNGNLKDNRIENLMLFKNQSEHISYHLKQRWAKKRKQSISRGGLLPGEKAEQVL